MINGRFLIIYSVFNLTWTESASLNIEAEDKDKFFSKMFDFNLRFFGSLCLGIIAFLPFVFGLLINEKFGEFLSGNILNPQQQEFVKTIIDYVRENGNIELSDLANTSPFNDYSIIDIFGDNIEILQRIVSTFNNVVVAA